MNTKHFPFVLGRELENTKIPPHVFSAICVQTPEVHVSMSAISTRVCMRVPVVCPEQQLLVCVCALSTSFGQKVPELWAPVEFLSSIPIPIC